MYSFHENFMFIIYNTYQNSKNYMYSFHENNQVYIKMNYYGLYIYILFQADRLDNNYRNFFKKCRKNIATVFFAVSDNLLSSSFSCPSAKEIQEFDPFSSLVTLCLISFNTSTSTPWEESSYIFLFSLAFAFEDTTAASWVSCSPKMSCSFNNVWKVSNVASSESSFGRQYQWLSEVDMHSCSLKP